MMDFTISVHLSLLMSHYWCSRKYMSLQRKDRGRDFTNIYFPCDFARGKKIPEVK